MIRNPSGFSLTTTIKDCGHKPFKCAICNKDSRFGFVGVSRKKNSKVEVLVGIDCAQKLHNPMSIATGVSPHIWILDNKANLIAKAKYNRLLSILILLKNKEPSFNFSNMLNKANKQLPFSPSQAQLIMNLSNKNSISINVDLIKVSLRKKQEQMQVRSMQEWQVNTLIQHLSPRQKQIVDALRTDDQQ